MSGEALVNVEELPDLSFLSTVLLDQPIEDPQPAAFDLGLKGNSDSQTHPPSSKRQRCLDSNQVTQEGQAFQFSGIEDFEDVVLDQELLSIREDKEYPPEKSNLLALLALQEAEAVGQSGEGSDDEFEDYVEQSLIEGVGIIEGTEGWSRPRKSLRGRSAILKERPYWSNTCL